MDQNEREKNVNKRINKSAKKFLIWGLIGLVPIIVGIITAIATNGEKAGLAASLVLIIIGLPFIAIAYINFRKMEDVENSHCRRCSNSYYGCNYQYDLINCRPTDANNPNSSYKYYFNIECVCPHCGEVRSINVDVSARSDGEAKQKIQNRCDKWFRREDKKMEK